MASFPSAVFQVSHPCQLSAGEWLADEAFSLSCYHSWIKQFADYIGMPAATEHVNELREQGRLFTDDPNLTLHGVKDGTVVAVTALRALQGIDLITMLEVHPDYQGQGIGTQLLDALSQSSQCLMAHVSVHQPRVLQFYTRTGFNVLERQQVEHGEYSLEFDVVAKRNK